MTRSSKGSGDSVRLDRVDWLKLAGLAITVIGFVIGGAWQVSSAAWQVSGDVMALRVLYEQRLTKLETQVENNTAAIRADRTKQRGNP